MFVDGSRTRATPARVAESKIAWRRRAPMARIIGSTPELDRVRDEGVRYARRLREVGALVEHWDVPQADHGYDMDDLDKARQTYASIARHITQANRAEANAD